MKKLLTIIMGLILLPVLAMAQTEGYDPTNPPGPDYPEEALPKYKVICEAIPGGAYSFKEKEYNAGKSVTVSTASHDGCIFQGWYDVNGNLLTDQTYYTFTMPSEDVHLYARFTYDPTNPDNPVVVGKYWLRLKTDPEVAGSFNMKDQRVEEGSVQNIYAYSNSGFHFQYWQDQDGTIVGTDYRLSYLMPSRDMTLTAVYEYAPDAPINPGTNLWDPISGQLIVDCFKADKLSSTMRTVVGSSDDYAKVTHIIIDGEMTNSDWGFKNDFTNISKLDMKRVTGVTELPNNIFQEFLNLQELILPATITRIGSKALYGCTILRSLTCYAPVPPTVGNAAFDGLPADMTVYVPAEAVDLYRQADGWKAYDIQPITDALTTLNVHLPEEYADGRYKDMNVIIWQQGTSRYLRNIVTDRTTYSFTSLPQGTQWQAFVMNSEMKALGTSDIVEMDASEKDVTIGNLHRLQTIIFDIKGSDGQTIAPKDLYVCKDFGKVPVVNLKLGNQAPGYDIEYGLTLAKGDIFRYLTPDVQKYTIEDNASGINMLTVTLPTYPYLTLEGKAMDAKSTKAIAGASVVATQSIGDDVYTVTTTTDSEGRYSMQLYVSGPVSVTISEANHVSADLTYKLPTSGTPETATLADAHMMPLEGVMASVKLYLRKAAKAGAEEEITLTVWDKDTGLKLVNKTTGKEITGFGIKNGNVIIPTGAKAGDVIEATLSSTAKATAFDPCKSESTVSADLEAAFTFLATERGGLYARFLVTDNREVWAGLYGKGTLLDKQTYKTKWTQEVSNIFGDYTENNMIPNHVYFSPLPTGVYTLVTMGKSWAGSLPTSLDMLADLGYQEGVEYVANEVVVEDGTITEVRNVVIPTFDDRKFQHTGDNTLVVINKTTTVAGNYLTINSRVDFRDAYKEKVSDVYLCFDLPYNCRMVDGSAMIDKQMATYELQAKGTPDSLRYTVRVPMGDNWTDRVKFSIVPSAQGNYTATAYVTYRMDGKDYTAIVGNVGYTVKDLEIWAPAIIALPEFFVEGNAPMGSLVEIRDRRGGDRLIGTTTALASGHWEYEAKLAEAKNLQMWEIYARITTPDGTRLTSPVRPVEYNRGYIQAKTVEMKYWNGLIWVNRTIDVTWDLERYTTSAKSYMFMPDTEFSFVADLTNNDPEALDSVILRVFTHKHEWINLPMRYIHDMDRWAAHASFTTETMPIGVRVEVLADLAAEPEPEPEPEKLPAGIDDQKQVVDETHNYTPSDNVPENSGSDTATQPEPPTNEEPQMWDITWNTNGEVDIEGQPYTVEYMDHDSASPVQIQTIRVTFGEEGKGYSYIVTGLDPQFFVVKDEETGKYLVVSNNGTVTPEAPQQAKRRVRTAGEYVNKIDSALVKYETALNESNKVYEEGYYYINHVLRPLLQAKLAYFQAEYNYQKGIATTATDPAAITTAEAKMEAAQQGYTQTLKEINTTEGAAELIDKAFYGLQRLASVIDRAHYAKRDLNAWQALADGILPCNGLDDPQARGLWDRTVTALDGYALRYITTINHYVTAIELIRQAIKESQSAEDLKKVFSPVNVAMAMTLDNYLEALYMNTKMDSRNRMRRLKLERNRLKKCGYADLLNIEDAWDFSLPYPVIEPIIDPSGYVYEGVSSNRLEGVKATAYYRHTYEDEWGDPHDDIVLWDAKEYAQENPLMTDANGQYQWDVPQGLWRVKFEKEGYETTYSEWLPVPPPQLDVNIPMVQLAQPAVVKARAYRSDTHGVSQAEVTFSKYMRPETMTTANVYLKGVKDNVETILRDLTLTMTDLEPATEGSSQSYGRTLGIQTKGVDLAAYDEVYVLVSGNVESYAGTAMGESYMQRLDIERRIDSLVVVGDINVPFGQEVSLTIHALPAEAASGRQLSLATASSLIASIAGTESDETLLTFDTEGKATITLKGVLHGTTALLTQVVGDDLKSVTRLTVVDSMLLAPVVKPTASRLSGTSVYRGQTVALACATEGATIYYTTDGSCPCESATRKEYTQPIAITDAITIRAMAIGYSGEESEIADFSYGLRQTQQQILIHEGWNWLSHNQATPLSTDALQTYGTVVAPAATVSAQQSLKLNAPAEATLTLEGEEYNPQGEAISLSEGWNWLGYPATDFMTLTDALGYLNASEGDAIVSHTDGFALRTSGQWVGPLQVMRPGQGYRYKAQAPAAFVYAGAPTVNARSLYNQLQAPALGIDASRHPDVMCLVAEATYKGELLEPGSYTLRAYCGDEPRGEATVCDGHVLMAIHGTTGDTLTFEIIVPHDEEPIIETLPETMTLTEDLVGTIETPYTFGMLTGIQGLTTTPTANGIYNLQGQKVANTTRHLPKGIYIREGRKVVR